MPPLLLSIRKFEAFGSCEPGTMDNDQIYMKTTYWPLDDQIYISNKSQYRIYSFNWCVFFPVLTFLHMKGRLDLYCLPKKSFVGLLAQWHQLIWHLFKYCCVTLCVEFLLFLFSEFYMWIIFPKRSIYFMDVSSIKIEYKITKQVFWYSHKSQLRVKKQSSGVWTIEHGESILISSDILSKRQDEYEYDGIMYLYCSKKKQAENGNGVKMLLIVL